MAGLIELWDLLPLAGLGWWWQCTCCEEVCTEGWAWGGTLTGDIRSDDNLHFDGLIWTAKADLLTARGGGDHHAAAQLGDLGYISGGNTASGNNADFHSYDHDADSWAVKTDSPKQIDQHTASADETHLYLFAGDEHPGTDFNANFQYEPGGDVWSTKTDVPTGRHTLQAVQIGGKHYVAFGALGVLGDFADNDEYDPAGDSWASKAEQLPKGGQIDASVIDDIAYFRGGNRGGTLNDAYDPASDTWETKASMTVSREGGATFSLNQTQVMAFARAGLSREVESYSAVTDSYTDLGNAPFAARALPRGLCSS